MFNQASLREFGDNQYIIAFVEKEHPAFEAIKQIKRICLTIPYFNLKSKNKKPVACDFYFQPKNKYDKRAVCSRLEKLLGVSLEKI